MNPILGLLLHGILGLPQQRPLVSPEPLGGLQSYNSSPPVSVPSLSVGDLVKKYFPEDPNTARAIFTQESQLGKYFQPLDNSPYYGVAQISLPAHRNQIPGNTDQEKIDWLRNPENNLKIARQIYNASGFNPWEAYTSGAYKKFL